MTEAQDPILLDEKPCSDTFNRWARDQPRRLLLYLARGTGGAGLLSRAAESTVYMDKPEAIIVLMSLLRHQDANVREGALVGLTTQTMMIIGAMQVTLSSDESQAVREVAAEMLAQIDECVS